MIKIFLQLVALHGVLCAPASPFLSYGIPGSANLAEKSLPWNKLQPDSSDIVEDNPGGSEVAEDSLSPELYLPGTRNLDEKSIPDRITLKKVPIPLGDLELPNYVHEGEFLLPGEQERPAGPSFDNGEPKNEEKLPEGYSYPNPTRETKESVLKETETYPSSNTPEITPGQLEGDEDKLNIPPDSSIKLQDNYGQYSHGYNSPDGTQVEESGHLISTDDGWEYVLSKKGSYRYFSPEGVPVSINYIADQNGYRVLSQSFGY